MRRRCGDQPSGRAGETEGGRAPRPRPASMMCRCRWGVRGGTASRQPLPGTREAWPQRVGSLSPRKAHQAAPADALEAAPGAPLEAAVGGCLSALARQIRSPIVHQPPDSGGPVGSARRNDPHVPNDPAGCWVAGGLRRLGPVLRVVHDPAFRRPRSCMAPSCGQIPLPRSVTLRQVDNHQSLVGWRSSS